MLRLLRIRNLAVIEAVDVEFEPGFNVLTGETGAGKSILVEAVGLLLGGRASTDLVRTGEAQASIEALFEVTDDGRTRELVVRREITSQGRSRALVDGALVTAATLRDLSLRLVELHGQHEHQTLLDPASHLAFLDDYAALDSLVEQTAAAWDGVRRLREALDRARMDARERSARLDLVAFQLGEIERAAPRPGEDEELAATRQVLANADRIVRLCEESYAALYENDGAVLAGLGSVWKRIAELAALEPQFTSYLEVRDGIKSQLEDLAFFLRRYADSVDASPERLREVDDRLALLERLKRKYGPTLQDVIARGESLARERDLLTGAVGSVADLEWQLTAATDQYLQHARDLSRRRRTAATGFSRALEVLLGELAMDRARFEVRFNDRELPPEAWSERGIDRAEFYLSPNPGEELRPLARIVSGGELSRVMLALRTLGLDRRLGSLSAQPEGVDPAVRRETCPTLVFDEVDAGIGGRVAEVVGTHLQQLGERFQVLCVTHLPQIAARAGTHYRIDKRIQANRTVTSVERLGTDGRVAELARMMGGAAATEAVRAGARELLAAAAGRKVKAKGESGPRRG
jgi:DNA repair protein RecN (Recombination protein N)